MKMKKTILCIVLALTILCASGCSGTKISAIKSMIFEDPEYQDAVNVVLEYFKGFKGAEMTEIGYAGDDVVTEKAKERGLKDINVIVLVSTFKTGSDASGLSLEPNATYGNYRWILTRPDPAGLWEIADHGYGY